MRSAIPAVFAFVLLPAPLAADELLRPKGSQFSVRFPGKPKENTQTTKTPIGDLEVYTATYATSDGSVYLASFTAFPAEAIKPADHDRLYDGVREGLKGQDGKVVSEETIEVGPDKTRGREIVIDKGKQQTRFRVVAKDTRLIQIAAIGSKKFVSGKDATKFLDSLHLTR